MFAAQVAKTRDTIAIVDNGRLLTYAATVTLWPSIRAWEFTVRFLSEPNDHRY